jgi:hypothetical protein
MINCSSCGVIPKKECIAGVARNALFFWSSLSRTTYVTLGFYVPESVKEEHF